MNNSLTTEGRGWQLRAIAPIVPRPSHPGDATEARTAAEVVTYLVFKEVDATPDNVLLQWRIAVVAVNDVIWCSLVLSGDVTDQ